MIPQTDRQRRNTILHQFVPLRCDKCEYPLRDWQEGKDDWNQFTCSNSTDPHKRWIQSPHASYAIIVDEMDRTPLVIRAIPPAKDGECSPGGYNDFGVHPVHTIGDESLSEAYIDIDDLPAVHLGTWVEAGGAVMVTSYLVRVHSSRIRTFTKNKEASDRRMVSLWSHDITKLAFSANKHAFLAARVYITAKRRARRNRLLAIATAVTCVAVAFIIGAILF